MWTLFRKELSSFFTSLTGYIVVIIFLLINSLFMWVFPGTINVVESGYANLDALFIMAPWVFLFLVPAVTMRLFSEEKKTGTIDLLLTRPLSDMQIVLAKYLAGTGIVIISLIPTFVYFYSIWQLGDPVGNLDLGGTWGAYIGLLFLASIYVAIGVFASSLSDNQIISFLIAVSLSFVFYVGFDSLAQLSSADQLAFYIKNLGINEHYSSISRGVIDSRDIIYFLAVITIFLLFTRTVLQSRKW
ncbi:gliding motility-associated ABC transporter permease subunit GldF [Salinivirga cyanobacteriivorans]|uniref:Gliding motility-associated ABC transporter permease protein GldF n=1 Tax=Salinivirga cyanobacteriivorans TaxID=1307839 RepID=A0A0S2I1V3_9BACT|nr:gliding motility-associated ABC transporter permease subunit GldF [Salinivirga cyanobacteriivorans]ALO16270.1 gliding motility-associated ABC transporter permease protein GldF [Salinivirga cyanobacteriivorans]